MEAMAAKVGDLSKCTVFTWGSLRKLVQIPLFVFFNQKAMGFGVPPFKNPSHCGDSSCVWSYLLIVVMIRIITVR